MKKDLRSSLTKPPLVQRTWERILSFFFLKQWVILVTKEMRYGSSSWDHFTPLIPPPDRLWADPFVWIHQGNYYIFFEERLFSSKKAHIACMTLDPQLNCVDQRVVLERHYHVSYPFLFEHEGQLYMLPETEKNRSIELYRCQNFPHQWVFVRTLVSEIGAVDPTLLQANGKWWLFANIREGGKTWDTLHLFYADDFLSGSWTPHPRNPIVKDIRSARPAGRIFQHEGQLIRPSQDCSVRYGYAINFNRISALTETDYSEINQGCLEPPLRKSILGTHTWNESGGLTVIDALIRMPRNARQSAWPAGRSFAGGLRRLW
jgi:hypothetical protein